MLPALPVRLIDGKNAARAAPMFAFAARRLYSAARMSGRCNSSSDGVPAGIGGIATRSSVNADGRSASATGAPTSKSSAWRSCSTWPR